MERRKLGTRGLEVPAIGLGCMGMSFAYGKADESSALATLERSLELGVNFWDSAELYGPFANEKLLGKALKGRRDKVIVATKFGWEFGKDGARVGLNSRPAHIRKAVEGSLDRLQTDYIDLYYQHRLDPNTPIEETVGELGRLVEEGKVRFIGLSEVGPATLRRAHATHPVSALQSEYSLWETNLEESVIPVLKELEIGLVAYSPVGRGFLTGQIRRVEDFKEDDIRKRLPRFQPENFGKNLALVDAVKKIAQEKGVTASQVALAWVLSRWGGTVPIPGTTRPLHLEENAKAPSVRFSEAEWKAIDRVISSIPVAGPRTTAENAKLFDRKA